MGLERRSVGGERDTRADRRGRGGPGGAGGTLADPASALLAKLLTQQALGSSSSGHPSAHPAAKMTWPPPQCPGADTALWEALLELGGPAHALDYVELFAGHQALSRALAGLGYCGQALDRELHPGHDLLTREGFLLALRAAVALQPGGLMWLAPPCSSWIWLSSYTTGRHLCVHGDVTKPEVVRMDALVERLVLLLEVVSTIGAYWAIEQPASSVLWHYPALRACLARHGCRPVALEMGVYGARCVKPTTLMGTAPYLQLLACKCSASLRHQLQEEGVQTTTRWTDSTGRRRCQGTAALKGAQEYPEGFGAAHALAFQAHFGPATSAGDPAAVPAGQRCSVAAVLASLPPDLREATKDAWWLRDFAGEPW